MTVTRFEGCTRWKLDNLVDLIEMNPKAVVVESGATEQLLDRAVLDDAALRKKWSVLKVFHKDCNKKMQSTVYHSGNKVKM